MDSALAYQNGDFIAASQLSLPVYDQGFVQGVTVAEQMRTFGGELFHLDDHIARLRRSLETINVSLDQSDNELRDVANELINKNRRFINADDDLGLCIFVTPGVYSSFASRPDAVGPNDLGPRIVAHTFPVAFHQFADLYDHGQPLVVSSVQQIPQECWPASLKCRSRMHYYLADLEAAQKIPGARAILLDAQGNVNEASTANVFAYSEAAGIVAPPETDVLPGISLMVVEGLAKQLDIPFSRRLLSVSDLKTADEVMLCSTSPCVLPVNQIDGEAIGNGVPGVCFSALIQAWSQLVGVDVVAQSQRFAQRESTPEFTRADAR